MWWWTLYVLVVAEGRYRLLRKLIEFEGSLGRGYLAGSFRVEDVKVLELSEFGRIDEVARDTPWNSRLNESKQLCL